MSDVRDRADHVLKFIRRLQLSVGLNCECNLRFILVVDIDSSHRYMLIGNTLRRLDLKVHDTT